MHHYHIKIEGIPEYINMLEDAQKQAGRARRIIAGKTLLLFASTAMLTTESYLKTNDDRGGRSEEDKSWADWKTAYKRAHAKARVKAQDLEGSDKFGTVNEAKRVLTTSTVETNNGGDEVIMKALEGYFDKLTAATINKKSVLEKLVTNNSKLAATNEDLVAMVKKLANKIKKIERETSRLKKTGVRGTSQGKRDLTLCPHRKKEIYHAPDACFELTNNKEKRLTGWKSWL